MHRANPAKPPLAIQVAATIPVFLFVGLCGFAHTKYFLGASPAFLAAFSA
jgi:hypothetical protein